MALKEGDIVRVDFTSSDEAGHAFNTTVEKKAVEAGIFDEKIKYRPAIAVVGERNFFEKIDEAIKQSSEGQKISIELEAKDAFGERKPEFVRMVSVREFRSRKLTPFPGMPIEINNLQGRVQTVSGGRVRVDFNHPLAGRKVKYELEIREIVKGKEERVKALLEKYFPFIEEELKYELRENALEVMVPEKFGGGISQIKKGFAETALKYIEGIQKVRFVEEYLKEKGKDKEEAEKPEKASEKRGRAGEQENNGQRKPQPKKPHS